MKIALTLILSLVLLNCTTGGNCRQQAAAQAKAAGTLPTADTVSLSNDASGPLDRVKVFKYDGSLQCGSGRAIPVEEMQLQLKAVKVFSAANKMDGLMHMQLCGSPTGKANVYEIDRHQLPEVIKLGFKEWLWK